VYDNIEVPKGENAKSPRVRHELDRALAQSEFLKRVSDLLVMANVGRVGSVELLGSALVQDGVISEFAHVPAMDGYALQRAAKVAGQMGWPRLGVLDIRTVWAWAAKHRDMLEAFDSTALGRALSAFSRLFERNTADQPMQLLWALVGLEALYVRGKTDLLQQVREKSQVLLGQQQAYKKKITQMYEFRSRFVHGDLDFPGLYLFGDAREVVGKYDQGLYDAIAVAVAVLVATIQEVIRRDWSGLRFDYTATDSATADT
jgi:hypothetical protein